MLDGTRLLKSIDNTHEIWYNYGVNGIQGITVYNKSAKTTTEYVFRKNVFGDVTHIYKLNEGVLELAAEYKYDAWGKCIVTEADESGIGNINRIRYRGYYFDTESGLYYLNARYYDPETGRFISADETKFLDPNTVNGLNLYAYCVNNPVMNVDPSGRFVVTLLAVLGTLIVGALTSGLASGVSAMAVGDSFWSGFAGGVVSGLISTVGMSAAVTFGGLIGLLIVAGTGFLASFSGSVVQQGLSQGWNRIDLRSARISGYIGMTMGIITYGVTNRAMRDTVGLFDDIFDKSLRLGKRFLNSLSFSSPSLILTLMFNLPVTIAQTIIECIREYMSKKETE